MGRRRDARLSSSATVATADRSAAAAAAPLAVRMARALVGYSYARLSPEVVAKAKLCVYDLLSSALAAGEQPWSRQAAASRARNSGGAARGAPIIGTSDVVSLHDAAFANGTLSHGLVRDDMHVGSVSHLGTVLVPALLALAATTRRERQGLPDGARRRLRGRRQSRPHDHGRRGLEDLPPDRHGRADRGCRRRREAARLRRRSRRRMRSRSPRTWRPATTNGPARAAAKCSSTTAWPRAAP